MQSIVKVAIVLSLICLGLLLSFYIVGHTQFPALAFAQLFTDSNGSSCGRECIIGIYPNKTHVDEVPTLFSQHPMSKYLEHKRVGDTLQMWDGDRDEFMASYRDQGNIINQITWSKTINSPSFRLGDAVSVLGPPDCVQVGEANFTFSYVPTKLLVSGTRLNKSYLTPQDPITLVIIYGQNVIMDCNEKYTNLWRGFASNAKYPLPEAFRPKN